LYGNGGIGLHTRVIRRHQILEKMSKVEKVSR
jgi:hypothetical protein